MRGRDIAKGLTLLAMVLTLACASDPNAGRNLVGYWQLETAMIQGEETDRLDDLYFDFGADGLLETNIFGKESEYEYSWQRDQIDQLSEPALAYQIEWLSDSTIALKTEIRRKEFVLSMIRSEMLTESSDLFQ